MALAASKLEVAKAKRLWEANQLPIDQICRLVGRSAPWLYHHMRKEGWQGRKPREPVVAVKPKPSKAFYRGRADWMATEREESAAKEFLLYGHLLPHVRLLRRRGYSVNAEGDQYRVDNVLLDAAGLLLKAAREARLMALSVFTDNSTRKDRTNV